MPSIDGHSVLVPSIGVAEVVLRGSIMYLALFAILRFVGRRQAGHFGPEYLIDWLTWRFPPLRPWLKAPALVLVRDGRALRPALAKEMISDEELAGQLREQGIADISHVKIARLEGDGRLSVLSDKGS